ncbi:MAG: hypothetical protein AAF585_13430 [Verrucomicrobiota bacterium]
MPIVINDMNIVADPPKPAKSSDSNNDANASNPKSAPPTISPALLRELELRERERTLRVFAH